LKNLGNRSGKSKRLVLIGFASAALALQVFTGSNAQATGPRAGAIPQQAVKAETTARLRATDAKVAARAIERSVAPIGNAAKVGSEEQASGPHTILLLGFGLITLSVLVRKLRRR
jgi:hypothetical protein